MSSQLSIEPFYLPQENAIAYSTSELNSIARNRYMDTFGYYQSVFNLFGYMRMTKKYKYQVHTIKGSPLVWQPLTNCSYEPTGSLSVGKKDITPDEVYMNEQFCHDELMDGCWEHFLNYTEGGDIELDPTGIAAFNLMTDELLANASLGHRLTLTSGQLYNVDTVAMNPAATAKQVDLFKRTHGTSRGWVKLFMDLSLSGYPWLNKALVNASDFDQFGFTGDILALYDEMVDLARKPLRKLINHGGIIQDGRFGFFPLAVVSDSFFYAVKQKYLQIKASVATNEMRITKRRVEVPGMTHPVFVYYFDDMIPIIPLGEISGYDEYLAVDTHFFGLVASTNIQLGHNFGAVDLNIEGTNIGVMIAKQTDITQPNYGSYTWLSHGLMKAALGDPEYAIATIASTVRPTE